MRPPVHGAYYYGDVASKWAIYGGLARSTAVGYMNPDPPDLPTSPALNRPAKVINLAAAGQLSTTARPAQEVRVHLLNLVSIIEVFNIMFHRPVALGIITFRVTIPAMTMYTHSRKLWKRRYARRYLIGCV
jgi:hypothetical protein